MAKVCITILNEQEQTLEQGQATSLYGDFWEYTSSTEGNVIVEAFDLAGNATRLEVSPTEKQNA